jgi:hypothetical protein
MVKALPQILLDDRKKKKAIYKYLQNRNNHYRATFPLRATTETQGEKST